MPKVNFGSTKEPPARDVSGVWLIEPSKASVVAAAKAAASDGWTLPTSTAILSEDGAIDADLKAKEAASKVGISAWSVPDAAFSDDASAFLVARATDALLFDTASARCCNVVGAHAAPVHRVLLSPGEAATFALTMSTADANVRVWDPRSSELLVASLGPMPMLGPRISKEARDMHMVEASDVLVSATFEMEAMVYDLRYLSAPLWRSGETFVLENATCARLSPDAAYLAVGDSEGNVHVADLKHAVDEHDELHRELDFGGDADEAIDGHTGGSAAGSVDTTATMRNGVTHSPFIATASASDRLGAAVDIEWHPTEGVVFVATAGGQTAGFDPQSMSRGSRYKYHPFPEDEFDSPLADGRGLQFSGDSTRLYVGCESCLHCFDATDPHRNGGKRVIGDPVYEMAPLASLGTADAPWAPPEGTDLTIPTKRVWFEDFQALHDSKHVVVAHTDGTVRVWMAGIDRAHVVERLQLPTTAFVAHRLEQRKLDAELRAAEAKLAEEAKDSEAETSGKADDEAKGVEEEGGSGSASTLTSEEFAAREEYWRTAYTPHQQVRAVRDGSIVITFGRNAGLALFSRAHLFESTG